MSNSNGDLEISVNAEGVEDAAGEFEDVSGAAGGGGGDVSGGVGGSGGGGGRFGRFGKLLTRIAGILAFLTPILKVLEVASNVLTAFVAPLAVLLFRLLSPALRLLIQVLPVWFEIVSFIGDILVKIQELQKAFLSALWNAILSLVPELPEFDPVAFAKRVGTKFSSTGEAIIDGLASRINSRLRQLPSDIGGAIASQLPSLGGLGGGGGDGGGGFFESINPFDRPGGGGGGDGSDPPIINFEGGLGAFVDGVTKNGSLDFP